MKALNAWPLLLALAGPAVAAPPSLDAHGDPLPPGAVARLGTIRFRHGGSIEALAFSPDGRMLASSAGDRTLRLWDVASGRELLTIGDPGDRTSTLAFTPDGRTLLKSDRGQTRAWDVRTGEQRYAVSGRCWGLSSDCRMLATASVSEVRTEAIYLRNSSTGEEVRRLNGHRPSVIEFAFSSDGKLAASLDEELTLRLWDTASGRERWHRTGLAPHERARHSLAFSPDGKTLCQINDTAIKLWSVENGSEQPGFDAAGTAEPRGRSVFYSADGKSLVTDSYPQGVIVWGTVSGKARHVLRGASPAALGGGNTILATHNDTALRLYDVMTGAVSGEIRGGCSSLQAATTSPDGRLLAAADITTIRLWELPALRERPAPGVAFDRVERMAVSSDGKTVAWVGECRDGLRVWDVKTGQQLPLSLPLTLSLGAHRGIAFAPDGKQLAVTEYGAVHVWDLVADRMVRTIKAGPGRIAAVAFSPDSRSLATVSMRPAEVHGARPPGPTRAVRWELSTGNPLATLAREDTDFVGVAFRGERCLAVAVAPGWLTLLWDLNTGKRVGQAQDLFDDLSPDGKTIVSQRPFDRRIGLWEAPTGQVLWELPRTVRGASDFGFSPDGCLLAFGGIDGKVRLWHAATGKEVHVFSGHRGAINHIRFAADGRTLVSASNDTTALVWDLSGVDRVAGLPPKPARKDLTSLWADLTGDGAKAHTATWALVAADGAAVELLGRELRAASEDDAKGVRGLVAELYDDRFVVRERAAAELEKRGLAAEAALEQALSDRPSAELRKRAEAVLAKLDRTPSPEGLRQTRAVRALELIGTDEARRALERLASGWKWAALTRDAREALERLRGRAAPP